MGRGKVVHQVAAQTVTTYIVKSGLDGRTGWVCIAHLIDVLHPSVETSSFLSSSVSKLRLRQSQPSFRKNSLVEFPFPK